MVNLGLTGSSGFIGSAMRKHFKDNNDDIIVLDNLVHPDAKASSPSVNIPDKLDWVLHFGADKSIEESFVNPIRTYRRNMHSTMSALDIAMSSNSRFLYMDSYVYGKPKFRLRFSWLFGLVSKEMLRGKKQPEEERKEAEEKRKPKEKKRRIRDTF